ncbi:FAD binding domain-containing protein [Rutstroemia sp. NJR-2017a WRK4]|nr:FAD binding domain-containing protein [Rutstroemia sp. NJR-2017a WRK4]
MLTQLSLPILITLLFQLPCVTALVVRGSQPESLYSNRTQCRCLPSQSCWPSASDWSRFNHTLGGKLVATVPIGSPCHSDKFESYNATQCAELQSVWTLAETHIKSPSSIMAPFFANYSCDPFAPTTSACVVGTYVQYAVNASGASDYRKTIEFVRKHNLRLTIRNTGHDYYGKATGAGAVAIWTAHLKEIKVLDYNSSYYSGKAMKLGAGVSTWEAWSAAYAHGLVVVGGNDKTVGIAGGYTQGGGHGQLVSRFGLAADQVLEWEVVTATGEHIVATPVKNKDLYWALSGGGGGTYAVVLSMTCRAYQDEPTAAANLTFSNVGVSQDTFFDVIETFIQSLPAMVDAGAVSVWLITNSTFAMTPASCMGMSKLELDRLMQPTVAKLEEMHFNYTYFVDEWPSFLVAFEVMSPPTPVNNIQIGGRFIPRSLVESSNGTKGLMGALRDISNKVGAISGIALNASEKQGHIANAAHPGWRGILFDAVVGTYWSNTDAELNIQSQHLVTYDVIPQFERLAPGGGAYLSEGDFREPNWQHVFYGNNYDRLRAIKRRYDPDDLFYALTAVGSDSWSVRDDGALCRTV